VARRPGHHDGMGEPGALVRRSTIMTTSAVHQPAPSPRENSRGISAAGIAGILGAAAVGAAAGAAISVRSMSPTGGSPHAGPTLTTHAVWSNQARSRARPDL